MSFCISSVLKRKSSLVLLSSLLIFSLKDINAQVYNSANIDSLASQSNSGLAISVAANIIHGIPLSLTPVAALSLGHLEADLRYNYEDLHTVSAAVGYRILRDSAFWFEIVPMIVASAGNFNGISPAISSGFGSGRFAFSFSSQYSFSLDSSETNDLFIWASAYYDINSFLYAGVNVQRSNLFKTSNAIDAGIIAGFDPGPLDIFFAANDIWNSGRYYIAGIGYFFQIQQKKHYQGSAPQKNNSQKKGN